MRLGKHLSSLTKPEVERLRDKLNLTEDEEIIFNKLAKGKSKVSIADECLVSVGTVSNRISAIQSKVYRIISMEEQ